jgi:multiple antibiotic resistance protein
MENFIRAFPNTFIPIFVAIGIFSVLPIFIGFTEAMSSKKRRQVISQSVVTALLVSVVFTVIGRRIFGILGVTVDDFKVAGGLLLLIFAILDLTQHERMRRKPSGAMGVVPLGVPLITGPAVLTTIIVLVDQYGLTPTLISLIVNFVIVWLTLLSAERIIKFFGINGIIALSKIMALLLASIAVMMMRLGMENILSR